MKTAYFVIAYALIVSLRVGALNARDESATLMSRANGVRGTCGENLDWRLDGKTLIINGTGDMNDYSSTSPPWYFESYNNVVIEDGVTSIGNSAFSDHRGLVGVTIAASVTSIGDKAFMRCIGLSKIVIPVNVKSIGESAFSGCSLQSIEVETGNTKYASDEGVLFNHDFTKLITYPISNSRTEYTIPDSVESIEQYAFEGCSHLITVTVGKNVVSVGNCSFQQCSALTTVIIGDNVRSIGCSAFSVCSALTTVRFGKSVASFGDEIFSYCQALTKIVLPSSLKSIGKRPFVSCSGLVSIEVEDGSENYASLDGVLFSHDLTTLIQFPVNNSATSYVIPATVKTLEENAFDRSSLQSVTIPEGVESIEYNCFYENQGLTSVIIPDSVKYIGEGSFCSCKNLANLVLGNNVVSIEEDAFSSCSSLETVIIPDSVSYIGEYAFQFCGKLQTLTLGDGLKSIGRSAFSDCGSLTSVVIPDSVETIGMYAFAYSHSLTNITIGAGVKSIGSDAFCSYVLKNVYFKSSVAFTSSDFFYSYAPLENICVPSDYNTTSLGGVNVTSNTTTCQRFQSMFNYCYTPTEIDGTLTQVKRKNATVLEGRSNGCVEYRCNNDTEPSITPLCTDAKPYCINYKCYDSIVLDGFKVRVELELEEGVRVILVDEAEIKEILRSRFGLDGDDVAVGYELNEEGFVLRVSLYLNDMDIANLIVNTVNNNNNNATGFLRLVRRARIYGQELFFSGASGYNTLISSVLGLLLVMLFDILV